MTSRTARRRRSPLPFPGSLLGLRVSGDLGPFTFWQTRRNQLVCAPRVSPDKPPTALQQAQRARFALAVKTWLETTAAVRAAYEAASLAASLCATGHNLWIHLAYTQSLAERDTLQRLTGENLPMPPAV